MRLAPPFRLDLTPLKDARWPRPSREAVRVALVVASFYSAAWIAAMTVALIRLGA